jgi:DNA-binding NarL/FixJ family response regulator
MRLIRVIAVDDHETIRRHVGAWVAKTQIAEVVAVCANADEGLIACRELQPDLVLCDVHMPYVDGHGFIAKLLETGMTTPVLLFSAHAIEAGLTRPVLPKTASVAELHNAILRATDQLV